MTRLTLALTALLSIAAVCGCRENRSARSATPRDDSHTAWELAAGRMVVTLNASEATVPPDRPFFLTLTIATPDTVSIRLPPLDDRVEGFLLAGVYEAGTRTAAGRTYRDFRIRLTPRPAPVYRIRPLAIPYRESNATDERWIQTRPVVFAATGQPRDTDAADPAPPLRVLPTRREIGFGLAMVAVVAVAGFALVRLFQGIRRAHRLRQMSPEARARLELDTLLARRLVEQGLIKEFYCDLTLVVRRYIERRHGLRAPEQTTDEFLAAAAHDVRFPPAWLRRLREFLQAADLVKYAAHRPDPNTISMAVSTARECLSPPDPNPAEESA